jgi:hypothetical protein
MNLPTYGGVMVLPVLIVISGMLIVALFIMVRKQTQVWNQQKEENRQKSQRIKDEAVRLEKLSSLLEEYNSMIGDLLRTLKKGEQEMNVVGTTKPETSAELKRISLLVLAKQGELNDLDPTTPRSEPLLDMAFKLIQLHDMEFEPGKASISKH